MRFLFLISIAVILSCKKETKELTNFSVTVQNSYFETLDTISFAGKQFLLIDTAKSTPVINVANGTYLLHCVTHSQLAIDANVEIKGSFQNVKVVINSKGNITVQ